MVKLTTFVVMCRAYKGEPTINLLRSFLNLGHAGDWLTLSNRGSVDIATYPCHVQTFPDPILYLAGLKTSWKHSPKETVIYYRGQEMDFKSFMMQEIDGEFKFLPEECIDDNQCSPSSKSVNNEAPIIDAKPLTFVHPSDFVEDVANSDDASAGDNENPLVGTSLSPLHKAGKKLRPLSKGKLPSGVGDSLLKVQKIAAQASKVAGEASNPIDIDSDPDIHEFPLAKELKDSTDCHWVVDPELIYALHKATSSYDAIRAKELEKDKAYAELERKCNEALFDLNKNPLEMDALEQDRASVVAKVVPDAATKLICSDEMGMLVAKLVKASIIYGRCTAFEEVAKLKEPFVMEKMAGYRSSLKQKYNQACDDLANASYPFLSKYVNDLYASLEQLLSKKSESLHSKPLYVKAK
ncbi:hypothetical protein Tco_0381485 [Tanacetum coccineum]